MVIHMHRSDRYRGRQWSWQVGGPPHTCLARLLVGSAACFGQAMDDVPVHHGALFAAAHGRWMGVHSPLAQGG